MIFKLVVYLTILCIFKSCALHGLRISKRSNDFDEAPVIESDSIIEGTRGKRISMKCIVNNVKHYKIFWYFKGIALTYNNIRIRNDKRISIENPTPNEWVLVIDGIDTNDEGYYSCRLDNGLKKFMHLIIGVPPKFTGIHDGNHVIVNTKFGENVTLACEALGNPQPIIYWYKNSKLVSTGAHLHLLNVNGVANSEYECVARNKVEPAASRRFKINVNFPAVLNVMYNLMYKTKSGELQVLCEISGNPINAVEWYKDDQRLVDSSEGEIILLTDRNKSTESKDADTPISIHTKHKGHHKYVSKLRITNLSKDTNGVYKCVVNGLNGDVNKTVLIDDVNEARLGGTHQGLTSNYKELEFVGSFLGRGARSNLTNLDEAYSQNLKIVSLAAKCDAITKGR